MLLLAATVVAILVWAFCHLLAQHGRTLLRLEMLENQLIEEGLLPPKPDSKVGGVPPGSVLNDFSLPALSGGTMTLHQWRGSRVLLIFVHPDCSFSRELLAGIAALPDPVQDPKIILISSGDAAANRRMMEEYRLPYPVLLQDNHEVQALYNLRGTPTACLVDREGKTTTHAIVGVETILTRLRPRDECPPRQRTGKRWRPVEESHLNRRGLDPGTPAPDFTLCKLDGTQLSLRDFRGSRVLLVFSDPNCPPCMQTATKLEEIHRTRDDLRVLMVSRGSAEDNQKKVAELELSFPIVLQRHWEISRSYAMFATPIGYLIDEAGVLSSGAGMGEAAILALASSAPVLAGRRK